MRGSGTATSIWGCRLEDSQTSLKVWTPDKGGKMDSSNNNEATVYLKEKDGTLKPVDIPEWVAKRVGVYRRLLELGLDRDEIDFILTRSLD